MTNRIHYSSNRVPVCPRYRLSSFFIPVCLTDYVYAHFVSDTIYKIQLKATDFILSVTGMYSIR